MQVHLVDGTYELFRAFYGAPMAKSSSGREVGATRGLLRTLLGLLREADVTHVACAYDHVIESFRNTLFEGYKTGEGIEPALYDQFELAERATDALGVAVWSMIEFEADDAMATAAASFVDAPDVERIVLCSPDKDLAQCVQGTRIVCHDRMRHKTLDERGVIAKFGVPPSAIPDYLALVGDAADGIPGVPRWGKKTAATLLARYESIDGLLSSGGRWNVPVRGAAALWENLWAHREAVQLYKRLATLRRDVPLTESLDDLRWRGARPDALPALCAEIGDSGLLERVWRWQGDS